MNVRTESPLPVRRIMPLSTIDEIAEELAATQRALDRLDEIRPVDADQAAARRSRLLWWHDQLDAQLRDMKTEVPA